VPSWGQDGEFLLEVEGMRIRVVFSSNMLRNHHDCALHAVDWDRPFLSPTGFRATGLAAVACLGESVEQAARRLVLEILHGEGKPKAIVIKAHMQASMAYRPQWLADALAGVRTDGQLAMFGDAPKDPTKKAPLSNAERQRLFRQRRKERAEAAKAGDFAALEVTDAALLPVWEDLPSDFARAATALGLLRLRNNQHAELARAVQTLKGHLMDAGLDDQARGCAWHWNTTPLGDYRASSAPEYMERQSAGLSVADERDNLAREVEELKLGRERMQQRLAQGEGEIQRLQAALQAIAAEVGGAPVAVTPAAPNDLVATLRSEITGLQKWNAQEVAERGKAFDAVAVLQARLQKAGLPHDYRRQPGE
jgi:hypothetical protein